MNCAQLKYKVNFFTWKSKIALQIRLVTHKIKKIFRVRLKQDCLFGISRDIDLHVMNFSLNFNWEHLLISTRNLLKFSGSQRNSLSDGCM